MLMENPGEREEPLRLSERRGLKPRGDGRRVGRTIRSRDRRLASALLQVSNIDGRLVKGVVSCGYYYIPTGVLLYGFYWAVPVCCSKGIDNW